MGIQADAMSENMVERVALAIHDKAPLACFYDRSSVVNAARAAIEAMREPSDQMAEAGFQHTGDPCWPENVKEAWRAMIDEALKTEKV